MELSNKLQASGWHFTEDGIKSLKSAVGDDSDPAKIIEVALNRDLRDFGGGALPIKRDDSSGVLPGGVVLQVQRVRNIAAPKSKEESKAAPRLLQLELSDGQTVLQALELEPVPALSLNVAPGSKIYFHAEKLQLLQGFLLLRGSDFKILGGRVDALYEKWDFARTMLKYARSGRPLSGASAPPPWVTFGKNIDANDDRNFKSLASAADKDKDKPAKENEEFNNMRSEAIAVASKAAIRKVFGGGGQNIVDHNIKKILEKGYSKEEAKTALQGTRNNLERALFNLKRRKDAADSANETQLRCGRGERNGRESKRGASLKDEAEAAKPAANATLFDFLTTKLRTDQIAGDISGESTKASSSTDKALERQYESDYKTALAVSLAESKSQNMAERTRFENNVSSSFAANRGGHSGRLQRGGTRSRAGRGVGSSSSYYDRGGAVGGGSVSKSDTNSRATEQPHAKSSNRNGHDSNAVSSKSTEASKPDISAKEPGANRRANERQNNRNGNARSENGISGSNHNHNRRRQQGNGACAGTGSVVTPPTKTGNPFNSHSDEYNNRVNKVVTDTANLKISNTKREHRRGGRQSGGQSTRQSSEPQSTFSLSQKSVEKSISAQRQHKAQQDNTRQPSSANCTQLPNGYTYDPSKIMGFQTKETNEFAMSLLKSQGLSIAPPPHALTSAQGQTATKQANNISSAQADTTACFVPSNSQPPVAVAIEMPSPPKGFGPAGGGGPCDPWLWKGGDLCMAKYWDDGRYYEAEITAVSENTCVVFFLGYGNHEEVLKSDILPLTDAQNRPLTNMSQQQHPQSRHRQALQQQVYVPPHKREY
ncbi:tudor domain-containing protein 3 [Drosophila hydei]|uniref:Survival of motor neuron-related-splicing factor 30 n=1 Tax=Drosophila hydei TaxID=7224 RepID=A0A6J1M9W5_DROHY|nr:tudor domain-containing protein 3 [Drosophila hydei]XP_023178141.2 tudor domain-containing protein 3 [Drosophila hydei]